MAFLRDDIAQFSAYQAPHPTAAEASALPVLDPLDTNESPIDLPADMKAALAEDYLEAIAANRYPDGSQSALKRAITKYATQSGNLTGQTVGLENVTLGNGSDELIRSVVMATCLGNHGSVLVAEPTFSMYGVLAQTLGVPVHSVDRKDNFEVDINAASEMIAQATQTGPPVRTVFMVHPNSPTGNALTNQELTWLKQLPEDILVVVDEAYFEFSGRTTLAQALLKPNWLVTRTLSKGFRLAAHRVGYGIAHPAIIAALEKLRLPYNLPSFSQAAATTALAHSDQLLSQIPTILSEQQQLYKALSDHAYLQVWPSDSNFLYVRLSDRGLAALSAPNQKDGLTHMFTALKSQGTLIRQTGGGLRISIGTPSENQRTLANIRQVLGTK